MNNKIFGVMVVSVALNIILFIWCLIWLVMSKDMLTKVNILEQEKSLLKEQITELEWQLENNYMYCTNGEE